MRHYLAFDSELQSLLGTWGISMQGAQALRYTTCSVRTRAVDAIYVPHRLGFCSRRLLSQYSFGTTLLLACVSDCVIVYSLDQPATLLELRQRCSNPCSS